MQKLFCILLAYAYLCPQKIIDKMTNDKGMGARADGRRRLLRLLLVTVLGAVMSYTYAGEKIPLAEGAGWDGVVYRDMVMHMDETYFQGGINAYHMHRVLPFAATHGLMRVAGVEMDNASVLWACVLMNVLLVALSVVFLFRLSALRRWRAHTEVIAFSLMFFNVGVAKLFGYEPITTDALALLLSLMAAYYFFAGKTWLLCLTGFVALMAWPVLAVVVWLLVALPRDGVGCYGADVRMPRLDGWLNGLVRGFLVLWIPVAFALFVVYKFRVHPELTFPELFVLRPAHGLGLVLASMLSVCVFYGMATAGMRVAWTEVLRRVLQRRQLVRMAVCSVVFVVGYEATQYFGGPAIFSAAQQLTQMVHPPVTDILVFLETPFAYQGIFILLILFLWSDIRREVYGYGIGYFAVMLLGMLFLMDIETRKLVMLYPFFLVPLMACIDRMRLRAWVPAACVVVCLLLSCCWYTINIPTLGAALAADDMEVFLQYPAQRYFIFQGPWQSRGSYFLVGTVELLTAAAFVWCHRRGLFYRGKRNG